MTLYAADIEARRVVDAIRLALVGAKNDATAVAVIKSLVEEAPPPDGGDVESVKLFLSTVEALGGSYEVEATEDTSRNVRSL